MVTLSLLMMASSYVNYDGIMYPQVPEHLMPVYHSSGHANGQFLICLSQQCHHEHTLLISMYIIFK